MKDKIITINNVRGYIDENSVAWLNLEDVARGLGFIQIKNDKEYIRWETIKQYLIELKFSNKENSQLVGKDTYIPENIFYKLCMKAKNELARDFQDKVCDEILPSIRKYGIYASESTLDKMINSPEFGIKLLTALKEEKDKRLKLEKENKILSIENQHNKEIVEDYLGKRSIQPIELIRRIINRMAEISKAHYKDYKYFWNEAYSRYYIYGKVDLRRRYTNAKNINKTEATSVLTYAEEIGADKLLLNCVVGFYKNASKQMYIEDLGFTEKEFEEFYADLVDPLVKDFKLKPYQEWDEDSLTGFDRIK